MGGKIFLKKFEIESSFGLNGSLKIRNGTFKLSAVFFAFKWKSFVCGIVQCMHTKPKGRQILLHFFPCEDQRPSFHQRDEMSNNRSCGKKKDIRRNTSLKC